MATPPLLPSPYEFVLLALASFRLTHFVVFDRLGYIVRRPFLDPNNEPRGKGTRRRIGEAMSCYWCTGIWISALLYTGFWLFPEWMRPTIAVLAVAGVQAPIQSWVRANMSRID